MFKEFLTVSTNEFSIFALCAMNKSDIFSEGPTIKTANILSSTSTICLALSYEEDNTLGLR